jgi:CPA2 family monovalent cation:H+ antiporter-2
MGEISPLVATIVVGIGLAFVFGTIANRLRISPLVGYLLAGVAVGPFTPGYVADAGVAQQLADLGVILLMFGVGLHFSLKDLLALKGVVLPGAIAQIVVTTALGTGLGWTLGWSTHSAFLFGFSLSISSSVVLMRTLQGWTLLDTRRGHLAMGWLIVQDLVTVIGLVLLPPLAAAFAAADGAAAVPIDIGALLARLGLTLFNLAVFIGLMFVVGRRAIPALLHYIAHTGSRELFRLAVLAIALVVAFIASELFGVSLALGAFFAGMMLTESELSHRAAEESLPLRDAFAVLFFVSIGMLFNPEVLLRDPVALAATLFIVLLGNGGATLLIVRAFGYPLGTALTVAAGLAQIGEFSFVLADLGIGLHMLDQRARDLILGASILSILINPILFAAAHTVNAPESPIEQGLVPTTLSNHAVLIGYGRVGQTLADELLRQGWPLLVVEDATDLAEVARSKGLEVIHGNAADDRILAAANLAGARLLLVAIPNGFEAGQIVEQGRAANHELDIVARAHFDAEVDHLLRHGADTVVMGEREIARAMMERARGRPEPLSA